MFTRYITHCSRDFKVVEIRFFASAEFPLDNDKNYAGILEQSMGARNRVVPASQAIHRLAESIPRNQFLGGPLIFENTVSDWITHGSND
jgi:hypothetical protein